MLSTLYRFRHGEDPSLLAAYRILFYSGFLAAVFLVLLAVGVFMLGRTAW